MIVDIPFSIINYKANLTLNSGPKEPKKKPSRKELIRELESIRSSLLDDIRSDPTTNSATRNNVPNVKSNSNSGNTEALTRTQQATTPSQLLKNQEQEVKRPSLENNPPPLPGQQSLFGETEDAKSANSLVSETESRDLPYARKRDAKEKKIENPFLPNHIRERLNREKKGLQELQALELDQAPLRSPDELVDQLVAKYLPVIEHDLRKKLTEMLNKNPEEENSLDE